MANAAKPGTYQSPLPSSASLAPSLPLSPLGKLFARQQPKVRAKRGMAKLLLTYAENDSQRIAHLLSVWMDE
jgi:hypothetical protein